MFHVEPKGLLAGAVITKGSWGKQIRQFRNGGPLITDNQTAVDMMWEAALETARLLIAPMAPPRFDCVFVCSTRAGAKRFRDTYRPNSAIYSVEPINKSAVTHIGDFDLLTPGADPYVPRMAENSALYWSRQHRPSTPEILVGSDVRVL